MSFVIAALVAAPKISCVLLLLTGTPLGDQLPALFQLPFAAPVQVCADAEPASFVRTIRVVRNSRILATAVPTPREPVVRIDHLPAGGWRRAPDRRFPGDEPNETGFGKKTGD